MQLLCVLLGTLPAFDRTAEPQLGGPLALCLPYQAVRENTVISSPPHMQTIGFVLFHICQQLQKVHQDQTNLSQDCAQSAKHIIASENKQALNSWEGFLSWLSLS